MGMVFRLVPSLGHMSQLEELQGATPNLAPPGTLPVGATNRPVEFFHLHAGIADYFHRGGQRFQNFGLQRTKLIKLSVSL